MLKTTQANDLIKSTGARVTANRTKVLAFLLAQTRALTHREIDQGLSADQPIDPVTLYRVLEWLVTEDLIHNVAGDDHVSRFRIGHNDNLHPHAHFQCANCSTVTCMEELELQNNVFLPKGFQLTQAEILLKGFCPACS